MGKKTIQNSLPDLDLAKLNIQDLDLTSWKFMMLIEGVYGKGVDYATQKYGYSPVRYYQLLTDFKKRGFPALQNKKTGPQGNHSRTTPVLEQILQLRSREPKISAGILAERLREMGYKISKRSVERALKDLQHTPKPAQTGLNGEKLVEQKLVSNSNPV
ncbi:MAG: helix-turn-helix domain-containing protein [Bacteroidia bacterium]|nr:helix-turn-helix domain-containing protein [Bacteroidia bacterium]